MATLDDVALLSQVSAMTVSRVINNKDGVSAKTREKVMSAIRELNYRPNLVARCLATNHTNSVGVLVSRLENPVYSVIVSGINKAATECGMDIILGSGQDTESLIKSANTLMSKQIDGLIVLPIETRTNNSDLDIASMVRFYKDFESISEEASQSGLPVILMEDYRITGVSGWVREDYKGGAKLAVNYLCQNGHKKIGVICHKFNDRGIWNERYQGFLEAIEENGCPINANYNDSSYDSVEDGFKAGMRLFSKSDLPTAIYCANDEIAVGLLNAAITCKLKVPEDISIIGHDGSLYSEISCPRLTTVSIQPYEIGRTCMEQVYHQICGKKVSDVRVVEPKLIEGESVKKLI